jgi:Tfp pilus assembly protein FimT
MTRRAFTIVELFLAIFLGSVLLAIALPLFRSDAVLSAQSVAQSLQRVEAAKRLLAQRQKLAPGTPVTLDELHRQGLLSHLPPAPDGCVYVPGPVGVAATLALK